MRDDGGQQPGCLGYAVGAVALVALLGWIATLFGNGTDGAETPTENPATGNAFVTATRLNVRLTPNTNGKIISVLSRGNVVDVFETKDGWARITEYDNSADELVAQWVFEKYLSENKPTLEQQARAETDALLRELDKLKTDLCGTNLYFTKLVGSWWVCKQGGSCARVSIAFPDIKNRIVRAVELLGAGDDVSMTQLMRFFGDCP